MYFIPKTINIITDNTTPTVCNILTTLFPIVLILPVSSLVSPFIELGVIPSAKTLTDIEHNAITIINIVNICINFLFIIFSFLSIF